MYQSAAIAAAAAWLACFAACAAFCRTGRARMTAAGAGRRRDERLAYQPPALLSLAASRGKLTAAAYFATVLDLAARGHLELAGHAGNQWCRLPAAPVSRAGLLDFEVMVLRDAASALSGTDGAPLDALTGACWADPQGRWDPFEQAVRAEARRRGLAGPGVPAALRALLQTGAFGVAGLTYLAVHARSHGGLWVPSITAFLALVTLSYWLGTCGQRGVPEHGGRPGAAEHGGRPARPRKDGQPSAAGRPATAWSSLSGEWRQVEIEPAGTPAHASPAFLLAAAVWVGILSFATSLISDPAGFVFASSLAAVAIVLAATAMRIHTQRLALPAITEFDGQVIARWIETVGEDNTEIQCIAVDDGSRAWSFEITGGTFSRYAAGIRVRVRLAPRTRNLLDLTVQAPPAVPAAGVPEMPGVPGPGASPQDARSQHGSPPQGLPPYGGPPQGLPPLPDAWLPGSGLPGSRLPAPARLLTAAEAARALGEPVSISAVGLPGSRGIIYRADRPA